MTTRVHTFCRICEPACGLLADVDGAQVLRLQPDAEHPVHKGFACHKGVHYLKLHNDPDRLDRPLRRSNTRDESVGEFEPVSWDAAITDIADRLTAIQRRYGKNAVALYQGNPTAFSGAYYSNAGQLLGGFGSTTMFSAGTQDCSAKFAGSEAIYGSSMLHPIPDLLHTDYFLCIGSNPLVSHMSLIHISNPMEKLKAIRRRGGKVVFVNPRRIESATPETGEVLLIKPDTDFYFLAGLLHEIVFNIGFDRDTVVRHAKNLDALVEFVRGYPIERVSAVTGIDAATMKLLAREFCAAPSASIFMSTGVNMGRQGALAYWMLNMISLLSGNLGRRGGNIYSLGLCPTTQFSRRSRDDQYRPTPHGNLRPVAGSWPGALLADFIQDAANPVRALIVVSGNPLISVGGEARLRAAFRELELIVVLDLYRNETGEMADYVLPATDSLEREDINFLVTMGVDLEPYVQYTPAVVPPQDERKDDWWILAGIQQAMGIPGLLDAGNTSPWANVERMLASCDLSIEKLKALPSQTAVLPPAEPSHLFELAIQNEDGLVDCYPPELARGIPAVNQHLQALEAEKADQLKLITRRTNYMINSWMHNLPALKQSVHHTNPIWMHPFDAEALELFEGETVRVSSAYGEVEATLMYDESLRTGVVAMTHGWGQRSAFGLKVARRHGGANVNALAPNGPGSFDPISNQSHTTGINVVVTR